MSASVTEWLADSTPASAARPEWLRAQQAEAEQTASTLPLPHRRQESWKYTSIAALQKQSFRCAADADTVRAEDLAEWQIPGLDCHLLVFVNGRFRSDLSFVDHLPSGVCVGAFSIVDEATVGLFEAQLQAESLHDDEPFDQLNLSRFSDGLVIHVSAGQRVRKPVHCLSLSLGEDNNSTTHLRHLIRLEQSAQLELIETEVTEGQHSVAVTRSVSVECAPHARLTHTRIRQLHDAGHLFDHTRVIQHSDSRLTSTCFDLSGALIRHRFDVHLIGDRASCDLSGVYTPSGRSHTDTQLMVEHRATHCISSQHYRGVVADRGRAVFRGKVVVQPGADGSDATQNNANLLLSEHAEVDTKPELEIYADEVTCSHGATIGQLDDVQLFYLRSRGIGEAQARSLLMNAFCTTIADALDNDSLKTHLTGRLRAQFVSQ